MKTLGARFLLLSCALACVFFSSAVHAQTTDEIQSQIDDTQVQIQRLQNEIAALQKELDSTSKDKQTLQSALKSLDLSNKKLNTQISLTKTQIGKTDLQIRTLSGSIATTSDKISQERNGVADIIRTIAQEDASPAALALISGTTLSGLFDEVVSLSTTRDTLRTQIENLSSLKTNLQTTKTSAEGKRKELATLQANLAEQKRALAANIDEKNQLLKETQNKESNYQALIAQKKAEEASFEAALYDLASKLKGADTSKLPPVGKGILHWPLDSITITQQFGKTVDSVRLYTSGTHDGVDFRASIGTPVRAALTGTVYEINQGAVRNCQYGKWVLIKHANGLATLYAHLSSIAVSKGQAVSTGQVIGYAGDTGYATGPHLHFTVYAADSVSLKQYTCKSGYTVTIPIAPLNGYLNPLSYL